MASIAVRNRTRLVQLIVLDVNVELDVKDENTLIITIVYTLPAFEGQISTAFSIERVR